MDYLFSSQSFKSLEKHQSPFKLSRILSRSRSRAQRSTIAYGSYIRPGVLGPLHLLVGLREQAENMMVICLLGSLSSHHTCSNKCLLPSRSLSGIPLLAALLSCYLPLPFVLAVQSLCPRIQPPNQMSKAGVSMPQVGLSISVTCKVALETGQVFEKQESKYCDIGGNGHITPVSER